MSVLSYEHEYQQVLTELADAQAEDAQVVSLRFQDDAKSRNKHFQQYWVNIYLRYLQLSRRLSVLMDAELQPQKLHDMRTMLNSCIGRMLEAKDAVVKNCGDYAPLDEVLLDMKLTPDQIDVPVPTYILEDRGTEPLDRRNYVTSVQSHYADTEPDAPVSQALRQPLSRVDPSKALPPLALSAKAAAAAAAAPAAADGQSEQKAFTLEEAVQLIQSCERGRQARQRVAFQLLIHKQQQYIQAHGKDFNTVTGKDRAATVVQKVVLGYLERKRAAARYSKEREFLGMVPNAKTFNDDERIAAELRAQDRKARQIMNLSELRKKTLELESSIKTKEGPKTMEVMLDEVLMRMAYARMESKSPAIVDLPPPEEGGSLKLLGRIPPPQSAGGDGSTKRRRSSARSKSVTSAKDGDDAAAAMGASGVGDGMAASSQGRAGSSARRKSTRGGKEDESLAAPMPPSAFWGTMKEGADRHDATWKRRFEQGYVQGGDLDQRADEAELRYQLLKGPRGIIAELRSTVDQLIAMEVTNLKAKLQAEADAKKKKKGKRKAKREPKVKKPKLKDPTKGVDLDTSMNTAIYENKLQLTPEHIRLASFVGDENIMASPLDRALRTQAPDEEIRKKWQKILRNWNDDVEKAMGMKATEFEALFSAYERQTSWLKEPSAAEIRRAVTEYAVLPLGSQIIHDLAPSIKALLFYGLHGTGKSMMAYAACNEAGANFFNLSPANFPTMKGIAKTIQLIFYVARMIAPSVIYVEGIEKIFPGKKIKGLPGPPPGPGGKKKKGKGKDPLLVRGKKMKKELLKAMATVQPHERVLLLGCTSEPWLLDPNAAATHFQHAVYFPLPNYATRLSLLRHFVRGAISGAAASADPAAVTAHDVARSVAATHKVPGDMAADDYEQLAMLTEGFTTGQLKTLIDRSLTTSKVQRVLQRPLSSKDFLHTLAAMKATATWERQLIDFAQQLLPVHLRRANVPEDFKESEEDAKKRKSNAGPKKSKA